MSTTRAIRESFLRYFETQGHARAASAALVPQNDPTLLFVNAGMVPFKELFLGMETAERRGYATATSAQRCLRAGGKHNDLENVGHTPRHLTLFEMLGNFSFGSPAEGGYFKAEAIEHAWHFLTKELCLPASRLRVSVYRDDDESAELWYRIAGLTESSGAVIRLGENDNFWTMGAESPTTPCGPCTEIFWRQDDEVAAIAAGPGGDPNAEDHRWLELWNLVFMQYRGGDVAGERVPLPIKCVDTGMGLERVASVVQGVASNFETDEMRAVVDAVDALRAGGSRASARPWSAGDADAVARAVVVDHVRAAAHMVADGVFPSSAGRGYILRRIVRRAIRYGHQLELDEPFLARLVPALLASSDGDDGHLRPHLDAICAVLDGEEGAFRRTLDAGLGRLEAELIRVVQGTTDAKPAGGLFLPPPIAFELYDSCGFPPDLTASVAHERGIGVDVDAVEALMHEQRVRAREAWVGSGDEQLPPDVRAWASDGVPAPLYTGGDGDGAACKAADSRVIAVSSPGSGGDESDGGVWLAITPCPFFPTGGGQDGDVGTLAVSDGTELLVVATERPYDAGIALRVALPTRASDAERADLRARLDVGSPVVARVGERARRRCSAHHTATHMLAASLRETVAASEGSAVAALLQQAGSSVSSQRLTFDFTKSSPLTPEELRAVESRVNAVADDARVVSVATTTRDAAVAAGAVAPFWEKYDVDAVRVVSIGADAGSGGVYSMELCGGTHVDRTSSVAPFVIVSEASVGAGVRRIEAVAGDAAIDLLRSSHHQLQVRTRVAALLHWAGSSALPTALRCCGSAHPALTSLFALHHPNCVGLMRRPRRCNARPRVAARAEAGELAAAREAQRSRSAIDRSGGERRAQRYARARARQRRRAASPRSPPHRNPCRRGGCGGRRGAAAPAR
jgi:alanyl-tRNA synthetase